jgi:hypothetical protein
VVVGDFDGDGRSDFVINTHTAGVEWALKRSTGTAFTSSSLPNILRSWTPVAGDFNGDGMTDLLVNTKTAGVGWVPFLSKGTSFTAIGPTALYGWDQPVVGDYNGDGNDDFVINTHTASTEWALFTSKADGTFQSTAMPNVLRSWAIRSGDFNADGRTDLLVNTKTPGVDWVPFISAGTTFTATSTVALYSWDGAVVGDFTGDGKADFLINTHTSGVEWACFRAIPLDAAPAKVISIASPLGPELTVSYRPLTDSAVYLKDTGAHAATYPDLDLQYPMQVVSSVSTSGSGISTTVEHSYGGLKARPDGRGILGFRWLESTQQSTGMRLRTEQRQDWPYVGLPSVAKKTQSSGAVLSETTNTYSCTDPATGGACTPVAGNRYFPHAAQSVESANDLSGAALPAVTSTTQYDEFGNAIRVTVSASDGRSKTTTNVYTNDVPNWLLGRLKSSTVQSTAP